MNRQTLREAIVGVFLLCGAACLAACGGGGSAPATGGSGGGVTPPVNPTDPANPTDVLTYKYDPARSGANLTETVLTPANVNPTSFGLLRTLSVDGKVDAQPLYLAKLGVQGAAHNVVYVATEHDSLYAFDADTGGAPLWHVSFLINGATTLSTGDVGNTQILYPGMTRLTESSLLNNKNKVLPDHRPTRSPRRRGRGYDHRPGRQLRRLGLMIHDGPPGSRPTCWASTCS